MKKPVDFTCLVISGFECGRVFPPDVGLDSRPTDTTYWLSSRFSRSVEAQQGAVTGQYSSGIFSELHKDLGS